MADYKPRYLTKAEVVEGLRAEGFPEHVIPTMVAITGGESSYNTNAYNPVGADNSYGLLQINMEGALGPARRKQFGLGSNEDLLDPRTNFRAAKAIYDSQGLTAWGAYTDGGYKRHLPSSTIAASQPVADTPAQGTPQRTPQRTSQRTPQITPQRIESTPSTSKDVTITVPATERSAGKTNVKDQIKRNLFKSLMNNIMSDAYQSSQSSTGATNADEYLSAAQKLYASEDPEDQALAQKYEARALSYTGPKVATNNQFGGLFG